MNITNEHEVRVLGLRRTGNHAVIHWILDRQHKTALHLNDVLVHKGLDPYKTLRNRITVANFPYWRCYRGSSVRHFKSLIKTALGIPESFALQVKDDRVIIERLRAAKKEHFVYSYEDLNPDDERLKEFESKHEEFIGVSRNRYEVIILRDAYNLFASLIRSNMIGDWNYQSYVDLYKAYAHEFVRESEAVCDVKRVYINYNKWFLDSHYRIQIARDLGFQDGGEPYRKVTVMGRGSSFDGRQLNGLAPSMKVMERWKDMKAHPLWQEAVGDVEIQALSDRIFGAVTSGEFL